MRKETEAPDPGNESFEEAAEWVARLESGRFNNRSQAELQEWLQADPARKAALSRMQNILDRTAGLDLVPASAPAIARRARRGRSWSRFWIPAAASLAAAAIAAVVIFPLTSMSVSTSPGEIRVVELGDGSRITLRGNSQVSIDYGITRRVIDVAAGEAAFDVAHHVFKPFIVRSENFEVIAIGTVFNVAVSDEGSTVTLIEGEIDVSDAAPAISDSSCSPRSIRLMPGQRVAYRDNGARSAIQSADITQVTAWQDNRIELQSRPLSELVDELNRTFSRDIRVADPGLANVAINVSLRVDEFNLTLDRLEKQLPIWFERQPGEPILVVSQNP